MNQWESVKLLQWFCGRLDFKHFKQRKLIFFRRLLVIKNKILKPCLAHYVQTDDFYRLCSTYSIDINVCVTSVEHIKCAINDGFYRAVFDVALLLCCIILYYLAATLSPVHCLLVLANKRHHILCLLGCYNLYQLTALLSLPRSWGLLTQSQPRSQRQLPRPWSWPRTLVPRSWPRSLELVPLSQHCKLYIMVFLGSDLRFVG